ncbi:uncharacterized threonine-rich GPI-anchored glycoprotein PJ4664.02-like isoform X1 [Gambusia affinis]|uniref:uncharacterized threonine-rich GPI-anchored glycoprotein PJ4664.02-like isoform X1 n=1 Tax=Gambusia affinis TaxID=33528 RepID=UPI001CDCBB0E|nr:uncharacterized threonine-rich GPI-anchored glycoprotein PJ4664.02-like isoform X1 [Gambusia affinis]
MLLFVLLVMMMVSWTEAGYTGGVITHTTKVVQGNIFTSVHRYKFGYSSCGELETWFCSGCTKKIDESSGEWCLREYTEWSGSRIFYNYYHGGWGLTWINNRNGVSSGRIAIFVEERNRSDINRPNSSPQTDILPVMRVPSNCQRNISLLTFDPDGDHVECRHGSGYYECSTCTPPSVLSLSSSCSLSFSPTNSSNEGSYAVQLVMEDFPRQTINLTHNDGSIVSISTSSSMSRIPVQFVFKVDPAAPSCTAGEYLPRFLPPTPEHGAQFFIDINEMIEINIRAEATQSVITELLFSGPINMVKNSSGSGNFTLRWTPSDIDDDESHPICFVVQANASSSAYQSELRCVIVTVGYDVTSKTVVATTVPLTTTSPPPITSTAMNATTVPLTTTSPLNASTAMNATTVPLTTTSPLNASTAMNATTVPLTTTSPLNASTAINATTVPLTTTSPLNASTAMNATTVPLTTTSPLNASTAMNATTVPLTTTSPLNTSTAMNATTVPLTTTSPLNTSTAMNATTVPLTTTSPLNASTALNATTVPLTTTSPLNTSTNLNLTTVVATTVLLTSPNPPPKTSRLTVLKMKISTTLSLKENKDEIEKAIKDELIRRGLPPDIKVRLLSDGSVQVKETAAP